MDKPIGRQWRDWRDCGFCRHGGRGGRCRHDPPYYPCMEGMSPCPYWDPVEDPDEESPVERKIREFRARHRRETLLSRLRSWWGWRTERGSGA